MTYYYLQKKNLETGKWEKTYLKKSKSKLIKQLAQKSYLQKVKRVLEEQIHALTHFITTYNETALEQIYEELPEERKQLVEPLTNSAQQKLKAWNEETYEPYNAYSEYKIYYYEHADKMDEPRYALDFVKKIELYTTNNIMQGKDLLITYEAAGAPLSVSAVRKVVEICV